MSWIGFDGQPVKWGPLRRIVTFVLGVAVIIDALTAPTHVIAELIVGAVLIGVVPLDELVESIGFKWRRNRPTPGSDPGTTYVGR
jgi:hypothetical protein